MNGMLTDPDVPGVEKVVATEVQMAWLQTPQVKITSEDLGHPTLVSPGRIFLVKGWNRAVCFLTVLYACYKCDGLLEAGSSPKTQKLISFIDICLGQSQSPMALQVVPDEVKQPLGESRTFCIELEKQIVDRTLHHISSPSLLLLISWALLGPSERFLQHVSSPMAPLW